MRAVRHCLVLDGKLVGASKIFTTESGRFFLPSTVRVICVDADGAVAGPTLSVGTNPTLYYDVIAATSFPVTKVNHFVETPVAAGPTAMIPPNSDVHVNIIEGALATLAAYRVEVLGEYL